MRRVLLEVPHDGEAPDALAYARACVADALKRGEAPITPALLYHQVLDDADPYQRGVGVDAVFAWSHYGEATVVYADLGESIRMQLGVLHAAREGRPVEYRSLAGWAPGA